MSRLQAIENALSSINPAAFQELCDSFLALRNSNYSAFSRTGSQSGKQKTIKGTPDTFLLLPNGKYIFVEYSTNISAGLSKLMEDAKKCIDTVKTGIPINQIAEIILCVNFNLTAAEIQTLRNLLANTRIGLTVYTLDSLSIELLLNHRDLTHEYLGLPLDTGQIVSLQKFIEEYNRASKGISTPLDNTFLHREQEIKEFKEAILQNDFVILTGAPGIGKTKLALEGISNFLSENLIFEAYCVSYKHHTLLDDLYQYFDSEKDYILFVDDANRIDAFNQITGFYSATRKGKLKIIITVRDYAFQEIGILCQEFSPKRLDLAKFTDEQIIDIIIAKPFEILNQDYHKEIVRIADGNPRLAIMTALLSKAHQNIHILRDVSDLFENYFSTFIKDDGEFAKALNIKCLGLIAFFYTIPYKNREITSSILNNFEIDYSTFIDVIDKLDKLELVEIQFEHVKIPEQNLSTYFFYKAFIKDNLLSFETLLSKYFDSNSNRFKDCVIPANNTFGISNVMDKLQPFLQNHWKGIKSIEEKAFKFLSTFWYYMQSESLEFIYNITDALPTTTSLKYEATYENNAFSFSKNEVVELLGEFLRFPNNLKDVIELAFEYTKKKPEHLPEWIHKIREQLTFDREDQTQYRFERQIILFQILLDGLGKGDSLFTKVFYELSKTFLSFKFHHTKGGRNHSFYWYDYPIPNIPAIQDFRQKIWNAVEHNFEKNPEDSLNLLLSYSSVSLDGTKEIIEFDVPFLIGIIEKHLSIDSFEHCRYVQDQIRWCKRNSVTHPSFNSLAHKFTNPTYEIFLKIDWDRLRDKEMYEFDDYREYEKLKEVEIRSSFVFKKVAEAKEFYNIFIFLKKAAKNELNYNTTLDHVIDENCSKNFELGCLLLIEVIESNNEANYIPRIVFRNHLITAEQAKRIWEIVQQQEFLNKGLWELSFYDHIEDSLITKEYVQALVHTVSSMKEGNIIHFERLQRFLKLEPKLFQIILRTIVEKNEKEGTRLQVWMDFFSTHFDQLGDDIGLIKKAYLQQDKIHNHFDYEGKGFLNILKKDSKFLIEYVNSLYSEKHFGISRDHKNLAFVWHVVNIEEILKSVFDLVIDKEPYFGILDHFCNSFFRNLQGATKDRAKNFLLAYCKENFSDSKKMNVIIDIVRHSMKEMFEEILLLFLSLSQDREIFSKIWWRGNGTSGSGNVILADIEMADWRNILSIVEKSNVGIKLIPIKIYLNEQIESCQKIGDWERQRRFLERY
ncbi:hypothetical protein OO009_04750 [Flavobacteriaceae bacterium KMM 6897]|nr:hypothetical protein [Flavobacteriaceae bacterium KMM 6897]